MMKHLEFVKHDRVPGNKTDVWEVSSSLRDGDGLGYVRFFSRWRRYCFFPTAGTVFDAKCMREIVAFMDEQMRLRK